ncbi:hypothetical protein FSARC_6785 [Fusarium sarcochroum]|uniref:Protein kinase domain-containing protein n=1 Tax=Fusarium sarcochroum TaxID=1208366 RepID=A0A8H4TWP1_9HYPO|nr:hypothetical protein FSARC_6785 [Fusarium sarcochroum]
MSWLNSASNSRIWMTALGIPGDDPYRSRNTAAEMRNSHVPRLFRESACVGRIGSGGVFDVTLYRHKKALYAVKKARKDFPGGGKIAFQEIQVVSKLMLRHHPNIIDIRGWDWSDDQMPVLFTFFAEQGTVRDFVHRNKNLSLSITEKRNFAIDIASGLNALHAADVAHGDIKLINTLVFPDPRNPRAWIAKVADFSHSVFGLSLRRHTSYPGTALYNAPEVRDRNAHVPSDQLVRCESFSYGLLVWELLRDGEEYIDPAWIGGEPETDGTSRRERFLQQLPRNGLLNLALSFLCSRYKGSCNFDANLFYRVFEMTLKDSPSYRKDLATIAIALDYCDRANIVHGTADSALGRINVWDFNPWQKESWVSRAQFVDELRENLSNLRQPNHAEFHFLMSRCFTEGYGVPLSIPDAVHHLVEAAKLGSTDAVWILEAYRGRLPGLEDFGPENRTEALGGRSSVLDTIREIVSMAESMTPRAEEGQIPSTTVEFSNYLRAWNQRAAVYTLRHEFTSHLGDGLTKYGWLREINGIRDIAIRANHYGILLCNVNITYFTLLAPNVTAPFLEVCASLGFESYLQKPELLARQADQYADTSYRSQSEFYLRLLVAAARGGQWAMINHLVKLIRKIFLEEHLSFGTQLESETGESPLHHLAGLTASDDAITTLIGALQSLGVDINGVMTARTWLLPFGIELYGTPLQVAIRCKCLRSVKALVEAGADLSLSHGDAPPPLILATSLHCNRIVEYLLDISPGARQAIDSLGVPTKKGWFEDLFPEVQGGYPMYDLIDTARQFIDRFLTPDDSGTSLWQYDELDGSPLIEAVRKGQKDLRVLATLINLGLWPRSMTGRWTLLELVLSQERQDPFRIQLLRFLLNRRNIENASLLDEFSPSLRSHATEWTDGWIHFFREVRCAENGQMRGLPLMQFLVQRRDIEVVGHILAIFRYAAPELATQRSRGHLTPIHLAILQHDKPLFWILMGPILSSLRAEEMKFSRRSLRDIGQDSIDAQRSRKTVQKFCKKLGMPWEAWSHSLNLYLTYRGPEWQVLQLVATREARQRLAQGVYGTQNKWRSNHETHIYATFTNGNPLEIVKALERYAVWSLEWEEYGLSKAEDICVLMNVIKMEAAAKEKNPLRKSRKLELSPKLPWWAPKQFVALYNTQGMLGRSKSASEMIYDAYLQLERTTPSWIPLPNDQAHKIGVECVREWFQKGYGAEYDVWL